MRLGTGAMPLITNEPSLINQLKVVTNYVWNFCLFISNSFFFFGCDKFDNLCIL